MAAQSTERERSLAPVPMLLNAILIRRWSPEYTIPDSLLASGSMNVDSSGRDGPSNWSLDLQVVERANATNHHSRVDLGISADWRIGRIRAQQWRAPVDILFFIGTRAICKSF